MTDLAGSVEPAVDSLRQETLDTRKENSPPRVLLDNKCTEVITESLKSDGVLFHCI